MKTRRGARPGLGASMLLPVALLGAMATEAAAQPVVRDHRSPRDTSGARGGVTVDVNLGGARGGVVVGGGGSVDGSIDGGVVVGGGGSTGGGVVVGGGGSAGGGVVVDGGTYGGAVGGGVVVGAGVDVVGGGYVDPGAPAPDLGVGVATGGEMVSSGGASYAGVSMDGDPLVAPHWEVALGMLLGFDLSSDGPTLAVQAGRQIGPVRLAVDYARYERPSEQDGVCPYEASRLGLSARYRVSLGMGIAAFGAYVEGGIGREVARHHMTLTSPSVLVGAGVEAMFGARRSIGFDIGYRMHVDTETQASVSLLQLGLLLGGR